MSVEVAVLDLSGTIVGVNEAWVDFCTTNDGNPTGCGPGTSYLGACDAAGDRVSSQVAAALRAVLSGEQLTAVTFTIPCDGIDDERWYDLCVVPRLGDSTQVVGATVMLWRVARPPAGITRSRRLAVTVPEPDTDWDLIEAFPDGTVLVDHHGTITHANRRLEELSGYDRSRLLGQPIEMLVPEAVRSRHDAWTKGYRDAPRPRAMGAGVQLQLRREDGHELPVEVSLAPVMLGEQAMTMASVRDVSVQRAADRSRRQLLHILDLTPDSVVVVDVASGVIEHVNAGATSLLGWTREELTTMSFATMAPESSERSDVRAEPAGTVHRSEVVRRDRSGADIACDSSSQVVSMPDGARKLVVVDRDARNRRIAETNRQRLSMLEDRQRIARDLHDTVIQALIGIGMRLGPTAEQRSGQDLEAHLDSVVEELDAAIARLRLVVFDTREGRSGEPLTETLGHTLSGASRTLGHQPTLVVSGDPERLSPEVVNHLLPVVREALSNVARHAAASHTTVSLTVGDVMVELLVEDDGTGPAGATPGGGTTSLRERSAMLGGTASILPGGSGGTVVRWTAMVGLR